MRGIFENLKYGNDEMVIAILDEKGKVISSNNHSVLPLNEIIKLEQNGDFTTLTKQRKTYLYEIVPTDGYQGFYGFT